MLPSCERILTVCRSVIADAERALYVERGARKLFGFLVTALLDQDTGKPDNECRGYWSVFALLLKNAE